MSAFHIHTSGRLLVSKDALLANRIFTKTSYRSGKSKKRIEEIDYNTEKWVFVDSLAEPTKNKVRTTFSRIAGEYARMLDSMDVAGPDTVPTTIEFTAETLHINQPFIRSAIETHLNSRYSAYTWAYLDAGINSDSVKGYAKQCALVQWIYDFTEKIKTGEPDAKRCEVLLRSLRMNLLTALSDIRLEVKIPCSETRFNKWFDDTVKQIQAGYRPQDIITIKRKNNTNAAKVNHEQLMIARRFYGKGDNISVAEVYRKWIETGKQFGWWLDESGNYNPPTEGRLYQLLRPYKNSAYLEKTDLTSYTAKMTPAVSRDLPEKKNHVWVIDGTAHNENISHKGKVRQHIYAIKVMDVATLRMVGAAPLIGVKEPFYALKEAILMGIKETGYKPAFIHSDHGPASKELEAWCGEIGIKLYLSKVGNARAKTIESVFNMADKDITRHLKGFSGMNRTALHMNSRPSEKKETEGKKNARSASIVMDWIRNEGITLWNERIIERLEDKPCNKTPYELWDEKESFVPKLDYIQLCRLCGTEHQKKLTINGLDIQHKNETYTYFPPIDTPEQREIAERIYTYIPMDAQTTNRLSIFIINGGDAAPVFDHDGRYLGIWNKKVRTAFIAETDEEKRVLDNYMALQHRVENRAKEMNAEVERFINMHPDVNAIETLANETLTGKRRPYAGRYDKSELLRDEIEAKAGEVNIPEIKEKRYEEYVDPDTGELYRIELN